MLTVRVFDTCPASRCKPERLCFAVQFAPDHATLDLRRARGRVNPDPFHRRHVDHQTVVVRAVAGRAIAAIAHGEP